jgi:succinate dehydrogenase / fumarate reductase cytochrome b subunit
MSTNPNIKNTQRPLSPHLQIYKPQITSVMSIFHRITGVGIALSLVFFVWFLIALADGVDSYNCFRLFLVSMVGK